VLVADDADDGPQFAPADVRLEPEFRDAFEDVVDQLRGGVRAENDNHGSDPSVGGRDRNWNLQWPMDNGKWTMANFDLAIVHFPLSIGHFTLAAHSGHRVRPQHDEFLAVLLEGGQGAF